MAISNWTVRPTRFPELGFTKLAPAVWRIVDTEQTAYNNRGVDPRYHVPAVIGPVYPTKTELLSDLERYARDYGIAA